MAGLLRANIGSKSAILLQRGPVDPTFQVEGVAPTNHSSSQKTRLNDLSYGIKMWIDLSSVLSQCTRLTDRQTYRRIDSFLLTRSPCVQCRAVIIIMIIMQEYDRLVVFNNKSIYTVSDVTGNLQSCRNCLTVFNSSVCCGKHLTLYQYLYYLG